MFPWSLSWLRPFLPLLGELRQLPHPALNTQRLPRFGPPMGSWMLSLSTRTPSLDPAGTNSPLLGTRRSFHYKFAPVLHLSLSTAAGHCQTAGLAQYSCSEVSFNKCVGNGDGWRSWYPQERHLVAQHACRERMSGVEMKPTVLAARLQHGEGCQLPAKSSWWISVASGHCPLHHGQ